MKNLFKNLLLSFLVTLPLLFTACGDLEKQIEPSDHQTIPEGGSNTGFYIVNEGPFMNGSGTISFFEYASGKVTNEIFDKANNRPLGNIVQSMSFYDAKGYIVVNNAEKVEVVDSATFKSVGVIEGLHEPRYFLGINDEKAYVTQWGEGKAKGSVQVVNLKSNTVTDYILGGNRPGRLLRYGNRVYVLNGNENTVSVIDSGSDMVVKNITVNHSPNSIQLANGKIWILCGGFKKYTEDWKFVEEESSPGSLIVINPFDDKVENELKFDSKAASPSHLIVNRQGTKLYFSYLGKVYEQPVDASVLSTKVLFEGNFYGMGYDPYQNHIVGADAGDFSGAGKMYRYDAASGAEVDHHSVGIVPNGFVF
jgi:YVTN family beta-propeller protein